MERLPSGSWARVRSGAEAILRLRVRDASEQRHRLIGLGIATGPLEHVPGAVDYLDFEDLDGNKLSFYSLVQPVSGGAS